MVRTAALHDAMLELRGLALFGVFSSVLAALLFVNIEEPWKKLFMGAFRNHFYPDPHWCIRVSVGQHIVLIATAVGFAYWQARRSRQLQVTTLSNQLARIGADIGVWFLAFSAVIIMEELMIEYPGGLHFSAFCLQIMSFGILGGNWSTKPSVDGLPVIMILILTYCMGLFLLAVIRLTTNVFLLAYPTIDILNSYLYPKAPIREATERSLETTRN